MTDLDDADPTSRRIGLSLHVAPATGEPDSVGDMLRQAASVVSSSLSTKFAAYDVTLAEWAALKAISISGRLTPSDLAERLGLTRGAVTRMADRLVRKGLAERGPLAGDARYQILRLTEVGRRLIPKLIKERRENDRTCFSSLSPDECVQLIFLLERCWRGLAVSFDD